MRTRAVVAGLLAVVCAAAAPALHVDPASSGISLRGQTTITLAVQNDAGEPTEATIRLEWLDPSDTIRGSRVETLHVAPGKSDIAMPFRFPTESGAVGPWYRLRYRVHTDSGETGGILTVAHASHDTFELRAASPASVVPGGKYRVTAIAATAPGQLPVEGVRVTARLGNLSASGFTDEHGTVALELGVPADEGGAVTFVRIEGRLGDFVQYVSAMANIDRSLDTRIDTDKHLYQPGQTLHMRFLCRDHANRPAAGHTLPVSVADSQTASAFSSVLTTDRFGVAGVDWNIPGNQKLGEYRIRAGESTRTVKISRYELPTFTVTASPDRSYYLPGQNATVEIRAQYLFGKPVPGATVRVVREARREAMQGQTGASGEYRASLDLRALHKDLHAQERYLDATYTAYVTDPTSGRTEEQSFDVRITSEALHLYILPSEVAEHHYLAVSYPDGSPAVCKVRVNSGAEMVTNRYGLVRLPAGVPSFDLRAEDAQGARGHRIYNVWWPKASSIQTDKTVYRAGEPIRATVKTVEAEGETAPILDVSSQGKPLWSRPMPGSGTVVVEIPWQTEFAGALALTLSGDTTASRTVLFPPADAMTLTVHPARTNYRPGEEAAVSFTARSPEGKPLAVSLGVAVVDRAVGAREGGGAHFARSSRVPLRPDLLPGLPHGDLESIDFARPIPADIDLLAEILLGAEAPDVHEDRSPPFDDGVPRYFQTLVNERVSYVSEALKAELDGAWPRDDGSLGRALAAKGIDGDTVRDPWDTPYRARFALDGRFESIQFFSAGPDGRFGTDDDLDTPPVRREWFTPYRRAIAAALRNLPAYPETEAELRAVLERAHIDLAHVTDPWGSLCAFRLVRERVRGLPRTWLEFRSPGADRTLSSADDLRFVAASWDSFTPTRNRLAALLDVARDFPRTRAAWDALLQGAGMAPLLDPWGQELEVAFEARLPLRNTEVIRLQSPGRDPDFAVFYRLPGARFLGEEDLGGVEGRITDRTGAAVPNGKVILTDEATAEKRETRSDMEGRFWFDALIPGNYEVRVETPGFRLFTARNVAVFPGQAAEVLAAVELGLNTVTVTVTADAPVMPMTSSAMAFSMRDSSQERVRTPKPKPAPEQGTPRVREYFPETLLWEPRLESTADGRARLNFRLADSITTWKLEAIASSAEGAIETAALDIRAFQPFFVDHSLPPILTEGDEIHLPVAVRNYEKTEQQVDLAMQPAAWAEQSGAGSRHLSVAAGQSATEIFSLRATHAVTEGKLRLDAASGAGRDAMVRTVSVHADRRQGTATAGGLLSDSTPLELRLPDDAIGQATAELKLYPSMLGHVVESLSGGLQRPHGCGEQTTSSTYPSLMLLRLLRRTGIAGHPRAAQAAKYLDEGIGRLAGYRASDGSYTYWGNGAGDVNLTAYVLGFLADAREFAPVQEGAIQAAVAWLAGKQASDGSWAPNGGTPAIALALARAGAAEPAKKALGCLARHRESAGDANTAASAALLALELGDRAAAKPWLEDLRRAAKSGNAQARWELEGETAFHGWGLPGQLEATALAVQALLRAAGPGDADLAASGLTFLLDRQDAYGVWYSGHTTVTVLEAVLAASGLERESGGHAQLVVNGHLVGTVELPAAGSLAGPASISIPAFLHPGANRIAIQDAGGAVIRAHVVAAYYVPWTSVPLEPSPPLRLRVEFDRTRLHLGERVNCRVDVERRRGTGMLLAEIGLPPGVDVDRGSLEEARTRSKGAVNSFEVLPDRLIVYLWPTERANFSFHFQPRLAMAAKSAPSEVYDYYNPLARAVVAPLKFVVE